MYVLCGGTSGEESACLQETQEMGLNSGKTPWSRKRQHTAVILAWKTPWTEEPGRLQSTGSQESDTTEQLSTHMYILHV